jgi:zinc protease
MLNRTKAPYIKDAIEFNLHLKPYEKFVLDNGVEVYAIDAGAQDVLQMEIVFYAGNSFEKSNAVAAATNYMLKNGTSSKTAFEINEHFEYHGASFHIITYLNKAFISIASCCKGNDYGFSFSGRRVKYLQTKQQTKIVC